MLVNLHVKNLALIEEADVNFNEGLNILTGETGAGKSIIIGSVNLALGGKASGDIIRNGADYALVEAVFSVEGKEKLAYLEECGVGELSEGQVIISRKIMPGKNITKVNGETVTLNFVKEITAALIDIHGQHEHQSLLYKSNHLNILDRFDSGKIGPYLEEYGKVYGEYKNVLSELSKFDIDDEKRLREISFLEYVINEIDSARLRDGEDELIATDYKRMANSRKIIENMSNAASVLGANDYEGLAASISQSIKLVQSAAAYDENLEQTVNALYDLENLYNDVTHDISSYIENFEFDEASFVELENRMDLLNSLKSKYGKTIEDILNHKAECEEKLSMYQNLEMNKNKLSSQAEEYRQKLIGFCEEIRKLRKEAANILEQDIVNALRDLNFDDVRFCIQFKELENFSLKGMDSVEFLISTNPGEDIKPLENVASGGELSRIMLALKSVIADKDSIEALIFDEIDTGISGRTAQKVAEKMAYIAKNHQVICITHLPQIAAMADAHFLIEKNVIDDKTITTIKELKETESIEELGRMLGGTKVTEVVIESAREMKDLAKNSKNY